MTNSISIIVRVLRRNLWLVSAGLAAIFSLELLALYAPQLIKQGVDLLASGRCDSGQLLRLALDMALLALGVAVLRAMGRPFMLAFGRLVERELRQELFNHVIRLPRQAIDHRPAGELMARATYDIDNIRLAVGYGFQAGFNSILTLVMALAYMIWMSPLLTLVSAIPLVCIPWLTTLQSRKFHACHNSIQRSFARLTEECRDSFNAIRLIRVYNLAGIKESLFSAASSEHMQNNMELTRVTALYLPVMVLVMHLSQALVWGGGGAMAVMGAGVTAGDIVAFTAYLVLLKTPLSYSGYLINLYQRAKSSSQRVDEVLQQPLEEAGQGNIPVSPEVLPGDIVIRNLTFTYPGESRPALRDVSMTIKRGETVALTGPVGSGKSTLLKLLVRLYEPPAGTIFLDGRDVTEMPLHQLRAMTETAAQDPFVFSGSIAENLRLACPDAGDEQLWQALETAGLADEVAAMKSGLETVLGEKGQNLSGGQKGRLSLARTLLRRRPYLLLDDPLAAVDTTAEAQILDRLDRVRGGLTNICVSHRPLSLSFCGNIALFDEEGRLVAQGSHGELAAVSPLYRELMLTEQRQAGTDGEHGR